MAKTRSRTAQLSARPGPRLPALGRCRLSRGPGPVRSVPPRPANGGGEDIGPTKRGKGVKVLRIVERNGLLSAVSANAANLAERFFACP